MAEEPDDASWTFDRVRDCENAPMPLNNATIKRLVREYRNGWRDDECGYNPSSMVDMLYNHLKPTNEAEIQGVTSETLGYELFQYWLNKHKFAINRLRQKAAANNIYDELKHEFEEIMQLHTVAQKLYLSVARLYSICHRCPTEDQRVVPMKKDTQTEAEENEDMEVPTLLNNDSQKNDNFQNLFLHLREIIESLNFRRTHDGEFFKRVLTSAGLDTIAFVHAMDIKDFVTQYTGYEYNFTFWRMATRPVSNLRHLQDFLSERDVPEAPFLKENHHLRSYAGDALGRGAVVYCSKSDFAFEYRNRYQWKDIANFVTHVRRRVLNDPTYECVAPKAADVAIVHLNCVFPYDTEHEVKSLQDGHCVTFRECFSWELKKDYIRYELPHQEAETLLRNIRPFRHDLRDVVGKRWRLLEGVELPPSSKPANLTEEEAEELMKHFSLDENTFELASPPVNTLNADDHFEIPSNGRHWQRVRATDILTRPDADEVVDAVFVSLFRRRVRDDPDEQYFGRHDVAHLSLHEASYVKIDKSYYTPVPNMYLIPLVDAEMQDRSKLNVVGSTWQKLEDEAEAFSRLHPQHEITGPMATAVRIALEEHLAMAPDSEVICVSTTLAVNAGAWIRISGQVFSQTGTLPHDFDPHKHYVQCGDRYFCSDTGRTWMDCNTQEIDHIYNCQRFECHDRFYLYALKGRLLFRVGEMDTHQITLFFEGYGGCGKSTIMNAQMAFFPPHLRGVLSSNIEPLFGMSQVMREGRAEVIQCNEVASDLNLKQEEWQVSVSGEWGSYAVKNGKPVVMKCKAQHFWVGNSKPGFKNNQNQMGRRLAGVLMPYPVNPRDGNIPNVIEKKMGHLQRREILAYHQFVKCTGTVDPMSVPEKLPPAFRAYHEKLRRETDPVLDFITEGTQVRINQNGWIYLDEFKRLYEEYRIAHNMGKAVRFTEGVYTPAFNDRGLTLVHHFTGQWQGKNFKNESIIQGVEKVE